MYAYGVYLSDIIIRAVGQYLSAAALCGEIHIYIRMMRPGTEARQGLRKGFQELYRARVWQGLGKGL